jgi:hypothetical protein
VGEGRALASAAGSNIGAVSQQLHHLGIRLPGKGFEKPGGGGRGGECALIGETK